MPIWINAIGVSCIGMVCGYLIFYSYKRQHPPMSEHPLPVGEVITLLTAVGVGGVIGGAFIALEGVNYVGPYGIGLLLGLTSNILLTMRAEGDLERP